MNKCLTLTALSFKRFILNETATMIAISVCLENIQSSGKIIRWNLIKIYLMRNNL